MREQQRFPFASPHTLARATDPSTSKDAAKATESLRRRQGALIVSMLRRNGPGIALDVAEWASAQSDIPLDKVQVGRRWKELRDAGLVRRTGEKRATETGRASEVYEAVPE